MGYGMSQNYITVANSTVTNSAQVAIKKFEVQAAVIYQRVTRAVDIRS